MPLLIEEYLPVIKNLAAKHMSTDAPAVGPTFGAKEVVAQGLSVKIVDFVTGVMDMDRGFFGPRCEEQALPPMLALQRKTVSSATYMVISIFLAKINMVEYCLVLARLWIEDGIRGLQVDQIQVP